jgi:phosphatidate cytidylyltransferase
MLRQRVISSVVLLPVLLTAIWFGNPWFSLVVGAAAFLGLSEFYRLVGKGGWQPIALCGSLCTLLILYYIYRDGSYTLPILRGAVVLISIWLVLNFLMFRSDTGRKFLTWTWAPAGIFYSGLLLGFWILLRGSFGMKWTFLAILATFAVDTAAFFVGRAWGKHHMAPRISPKKTWEGSAGGMVGGTAATVILSLAFGLMETDTSAVDLTGMPVRFWQVVLLGILIGILAQLGDLSESMLKRRVGAKDAGELIPGHGGILDRLDSLIFIGVLVYSYLTWIR